MSPPGNPAPMYRVSYCAPRTGELTEEEFNDFPTAEARAAELGQTLDRVKVTSVLWEEVHVLSFGRKTKHNITPMPYGAATLWCDCGFRTSDQAAIDRHHDLAGWKEEKTGGPYLESATEEIK